MPTISINHILRRWLVSLSGVLLGLSAAILLLLWIGNAPPSAQAAGLHLSLAEGPEVRASADRRATMKDHLTMEGSIGLVWLTSSPATTLTGETTNDRFGFSSGTAGDINGDGYSDIIIGAFGSLTGTGRVYVYTGTANGLSSILAFTATGETPDSYLGAAAATAGDVNGDGYDDVVVGAPRYNSDAGRAYLYLGSAGGLSSSPAFTITGRGGSIDQLGQSVGAAGDMNGDGYADVIVGAYGYNLFTGRAYVYFGSATGLNPTPTITITGEITSSELGVVLGTAGDVNGDSYSDIIIGAPGYFTNTGKVYVYLGSPSGLSATPAWTVTGEAPNRFLGNSLATAGDINGDGYSDVIIGTLGDISNTWQIHVYGGSESGLSISPALTITGTGRSVSTAGDVNGDGYADIILTNPGYLSCTGQAHIYLGSKNGLSAAPALIVTGEATNNYFGYSTATAGDVNGDGYADIIIGAPNFNDGVGRAYVYYGAADAKLFLPLIMR